MIQVGPALLPILLALAGPPNIILVVADDMGWGDLGAYGHPTIRTPNLDRLAVEGQRWTTFYSGAPYCTASRAGLLTGRLPVRSGMASETRTVLFPDSVGGLPPSEVTIPEILKGRGYATAMMGKWHLGHLPQHQPEKHGFDLYFGIPYSNDMDATLPDGPAKNALIRTPKDEYFNVPVFSGGKIVERPAHQETLTRRYIDKSIEFIRANREQPFFLYLAHHAPHVPLFAHRDFAGPQRPRRLRRRDRGDRRRRGPAARGPRRAGPRAEHPADLHQRQRPLARAEGPSAARRGRCATARGRRSKAGCGCPRSSCGRAP